MVSAISEGAAGSLKPEKEIEVFRLIAELTGPNVNPEILQNNIDDALKLKIFRFFVSGSGNFSEDIEKLAGKRMELNSKLSEQGHISETGTVEGIKTQIRNIRYVQTLLNILNNPADKFLSNKNIKNIKKILRRGK